MSVIERVWAMPNAETFSIPPIRALLDSLELGESVVDPFARNSTRAHWRNDLSPATDAEFHMDAEAFADMLLNRGTVATGLLFDPPYSFRQAKEVYQGVGLQFGKDQQQQVGRWARLKDRLARVLQPGGIAVSFGWSTTGFGKKRGFVFERCLIVNHGSAHHDTLCTVERKTAGEAT